MRNLRKLLAVIVAICVVATFTVPAFAETTTTATKTDAQIAEDLGMIQGSGSGVTAEYLASQPDRLQAAIMLLRLKGLEDEAKAFTGTDTWADTKDYPNLSATNKAILAYLKAHPELGYNGIGNDKFGPLLKMAAKDYTKLMLIALGYEFGTDFTNETLLTFAVSKGLVKNLDLTSFTVKDLCTATIEALKTTVKGSEKTLVAQLAESDAAFAAKAATAGLYTVPVIAFGVDSVTAINLKQVKVVFNRTVDPVTAGTPTNYSIGASTYLQNGTAGTTDTDIVDAAVQADGKTVILTLKGSVGNQKASQSVTIKAGIKDSTGVALAAAIVKTDVSYLDTTVPSVQGVTAVGPQTIEVTFNEPVTKGTVGTSATTAITPTYFLVDSGAIGVLTATANYDKNKVTLTLTAPLSTGTHTVVVNNAAATDFVDFANYAVIRTPMTLTYTPDTSTPTVSVYAATPSYVVLKFSKAVKNVNNATIYHDFSNLGASAAASITPGTGDGTYSEYWTVPFATNLITAPCTIYIVNLVSAPITDRFGITLADTTVSATPTIDNIAPTVTSVVGLSNKIIAITFSEAVNSNDAVNPLYYTFQNSEGTALTAAAAAGLDAYGHPSGASISYDSNSNTTYITLGGALANGTYKLVSSTIRDIATYTSNRLVSNTQTFTVTNTSTLQLQNAVYAAPGKVTLTFNKAVSTSGTNSALLTTNYRIDWDGTGTTYTSSALPAGSSIIIGASSNTVVITLGSYANYANGTTLIAAAGVGDATGGAIDPFANSKAVSNDTGAVNADVINVKLLSPTAFTFEVKQPLQAVDYSKILLNVQNVSSATFVNQILSDGVTFGAVVTAQVYSGNPSYPLNTVLTGGVMTTGAGPTSLPLTFTAGAFTNLQGTASAATAATGTITDLASATLVSATLKDSAVVDGRVDTASIVLSEPVLVGSVSTGSFVVYGYSVLNVTPTNLASGAASQFDVTLVPQGVHDTGASTKVYLGTTLYDASFNVSPVTSYATGIATTDGANPVITSIILANKSGGTAGTIEDGDVITITFSEAIKASTINATLVAGGTVTGVAAASTGGVTGVVGGTVTVTGITSFSAGAALAGAVSHTVNLALSADGKTLTITLNTGASQIITTPANGISTTVTTTLTDNATVAKTLGAQTTEVTPTGSF